MEYLEKQDVNSDSYWIKRNKYYYDRLASFYRFIIPKGSRVLQVGCRSGFLLDAIEPSVGVGIDKNSQLINQAQEKYSHLKFFSGDITSLGDDQFDYIILSHTLMKEYDVQLFLEELKRFCNQETRIVIGICSDLWEPVLKLGKFARMRRNEPFLNWLQLQDLENFLRLAGYEVVSKDYKTLFPKYIPLVSTFFNSIVANIPLIRRLCLDQFIVARPEAKPYDKNSLTVSVVVPCKNEKGNIENAFNRLPRMGKHTELIFVEGGSSDGTMDEIKRVSQLSREGISIKYFKQDGKGKNNAVRIGFDSASGDVLMILDADLTVPPEELTKFWDAITSNRGEFINGVRLIYAMESEAMRFLNLIANKMFSIGFSWMLNQRIRDTLCGTKVLFKRDWDKINKSRKFFGDFDPFGDFDLIFGAVKNNLKLLDMPIHYKDRQYGSTQISRFRHGLILIRMFWFAFIKFRI